MLKIFPKCPFGNILSKIMAPVGTYTMILYLNFENKQSEKNIRTRVSGTEVKTNRNVAFTAVNT